MQQHSSRQAPYAERANEALRAAAGHVSRRRFVRGALAGLAWTAALPLALRAIEPSEHAAPGLDAKLRGLLEQSNFVYVSPLKTDGNESSCHAEVWFGWLDGRVVMTCASDRWKVRSIGKGLDRARIWVGNHGRWKGMISNNEGFRRAPSFVASARTLEQDDALLERLLAAYAKKYPDEIDRLGRAYASGACRRHSHATQLCATACLTRGVSTRRQRAGSSPATRVQLASPASSLRLKAASTDAEEFSKRSSPFGPRVHG